MNAEVFQKVVWEEMLYAQMRSNYFAELVRHYMNLDKALRVLALLASSGVVVTVLLEANHDLLKFGVPILAAAISFWLLLSQYTTMSREASDLHVGWARSPVTTKTFGLISTRRTLKQSTSKSMTGLNRCQEVVRTFQIRKTV